MDSSRPAAGRLLVIGTSASEACGVRDYAQVVGRALRDQGAHVELQWWEQDVRWSLRTAIEEHSRWLTRVAASVRASSPDWIIWHYSVFLWGASGIPYLAPRTARRLGQMGVPVLLVAHELAFPFGRGGWKGRLWAASQRVALSWPIRVSSAVVVTTEERLRWLNSRRWLPGRRARFLPVCSNVSVDGIRGNPAGELVLGVFGFGAPETLAFETTSAVARLRSAGIDARLLLVGAPGEKGQQADRWRAAAEQAGVSEVFAFTGVLPLEELARELDGSDIVVLPDRGGPSSRKGTVAAALALGKAAVAVQGPEQWAELVEDKALVLVEPSCHALAQALGELARSAELRRTQGRRAAAFYERRMTPALLACATLSLLEPTFTVRS
jgi:glycosyltransferase involved in cell wall biosynthesis